MRRIMMMAVILLGIGCSGAGTNPGPVTCVPGCCNEACPGSFEFCAKDKGACAPVSCARDGDCAGLGACDRNSRLAKTFVCDQGFCRRKVDHCPKECSADAHCKAGESCFCFKGTCCWCDVHVCKTYSDCAVMRQVYPGVEFSCTGGRCVAQ